MSNLTIPAAINAAKVYIDGDNTVTGIAEVTLPEVKYTVVEIEGFDVAGKMEEPILGSTDVLDLTIKFSALNGDLSKLTDGIPHKFHIRAAQQNIVQASGVAELKAVKIDVRGKVKEFKAGTIKNGEKTETEIVVSCITYKVEINGEVLTDIDKLNFFGTIGETIKMLS